jgi:hypothetical protein
MSEHERFLVTFDSARGMPVKVERIGEAGELTEEGLVDFLRLLSVGSAAEAPQQITINIYGSGPQATAVMEKSAGSPRYPNFHPPSDSGPYYTKKKE